MKSSTFKFTCDNVSDDCVRECGAVSDIAPRAESSMCKQNGASRVDTMRPLYTRRTHGATYLPCAVVGKEHSTHGHQWSRVFSTALATVINHRSREL